MTDETGKTVVWEKRRAMGQLLTCTSVPLGYDIEFHGSRLSMENVMLTPEEAVAMARAILAHEAKRPCSHCGVPFDTPTPRRNGSVCPVCAKLTC